MGVQGLLPQLKSITRRIHISKYRGKTVAVDAYCLLHRGAYSCAKELVEGEKTERFVYYCLNRLQLLLNNGVIPYVVFDGGPLPNKAEEEVVRARNREEQRQRARDLWAKGNKAASMEAYQRAVDVTPDMAFQLIQALTHRNIQYVVAPYEADAQMAYLALRGIVDAVITEDSDLLAYGSPATIFKMDAEGNGDEVLLQDLPNCRNLDLQGWNQELFQQMCVMAGCDFCKGLPGIGIKRAHTHIRRARDFLLALRALRFDGVRVPQGYEIKFQRALWTFRHQRIYCPRQREVFYLSEPAGGSLAASAAVPQAAELMEGEADFLGPWLPVHVAQGIAEGRLHPVTYKPFVETTMSSGNHWQSTVKCAPQELGSEKPILKHFISKEARQDFKKPRIARVGDADARSNESTGRSCALARAPPHRRLSSLKSSLQQALGTQAPIENERIGPVCEAPYTRVIEEVSLPSSRTICSRSNEKVQRTESAEMLTQRGTPVEPSFVPPSPSSQATASNEVHHHDQGIDDASIVFTEEHLSSHPVLREMVSNSERNQDRNPTLFAAFPCNMPSKETSKKKSMLNEN